MTTYRCGNFSVSTAEDEKNYFCGQSQLLQEQVRFAEDPPSGEYRIESGRLLHVQREPGQSVRIIPPLVTA